MPFYYIGDKKYNVPDTDVNEFMSTAGQKGLKPVKAVLQTANGKGYLVPEDSVNDFIQSSAQTDLKVSTDKQGNPIIGKITPEYRQQLAQQSQDLDIKKLKKQSLNQSEQAAIIKANPEFATSPEMQDRYNRLVRQSAKTNEIVTTKETGMDKWERAAYQTGKDLKDSGLLGEIATYPMAAIAGTVELIMGVPMAATAPTKFSKGYSGIMRGLSGGMNEGDNIVQNLIKGTIYSLPMVLPYSLLGKAGSAIGTATTMGLVSNQQIAQDIKAGTLDNRKLAADIISAGVQSFTETGFTKGEFDTIGKLFKAGKKEAADAYIKKVVTNAMQPKMIKTVGSVVLQESSEEVSQYVQDVLAQHFIAGVPLPDKKEFVKQIALNAAGGALGGFVIGGVGSALQIVPNIRMNKYLNSSQSPMAKNINDAIRLANDGNFEAAKAMYNEAENKKTDKTNKYELRALGLLKGGLAIADKATIIKEAVAKTEQVNTEGFTSEVQRIDDLISQARQEKDTAKANELIMQATEAKDALLSTHKAEYSMKAMEQQQRIDDIVTRQKLNKKETETQPIAEKEPRTIKENLKVENAQPVTKETTVKEKPKKIVIKQDNTVEYKGKVLTNIKENTDDKGNIISITYTTENGKENTTSNKAIMGMYIAQKYVGDVNTETLNADTVNDIESNNFTVDQKTEAEQKTEATQNEPKVHEVISTYYDKELEKALTGKVFPSQIERQIVLIEQAINKLESMEQTEYVKSTRNAFYGIMQELEALYNQVEIKAKDVTNDTGTKGQSNTVSPTSNTTQTKENTEAKTKEVKTKPVVAKKATTEKPVAQSVPEPKAEAKAEPKPVQKKTVTEGGVTISTERQLNALAKKRGELVDQLVKAKAELKKEPKSSVSKQAVADIESEIMHIDKEMEGLKDNIRYKTIEQPQIEAVRKKYEDTPQWLKAPNGKPTNLNELQWLQVRTPNFKNWFGDWENDPANASKVVDENSEPMVVYHGSGGDVFEPITTFKQNYDMNMPSGDNRAVTFFAKEPSAADNYAMTAEYSGYSLQGMGANVYPVFLNIRNITDINAKGEGGNGFGGALEKAFIKSLKNNSDGLVVRNVIDAPEFIFDPKNRGEYYYAKQDIYGRMKNIPQTNYAVFSPTQIKSATANNGYFDPNNADIRYKDTLAWLANHSKTIKSVTKAFIKVIPRNLIKKVSYSKERAFIDLNNGESIIIDLTTGVIEKTKSGRIEFYPVGSVLALVDIAKSYNANNKVAYHEAGHLAFNMFLSQNQRDTLIAEYKTEEKAMDAFAEFMKDRSSFMGKVRTVFAYLRAKLMQLWNNSMSPEWSTQQNQIFVDMAKGKYNNSQPIQGNATKYSTISNETRAKRTLSENEMKILNASDNFIKQSKEIADRVYDNVRGAENQEAFAKALQNRVTYILRKLFGVNTTDATYKERLNKLLGVADIKNATPQQVFGFLSQYDPLMVHYMRDGLISNLMAKLAATGINWETAFAHYATWGDVIYSMSGKNGTSPLQPFMSADLRMARNYGKGGVTLVDKTSAGFIQYKELTSWRSEVEASLLLVETSIPTENLYKAYTPVIQALESRYAADAIISNYVANNNLSETQAEALKSLYKDIATYFDKFKTYIEAHPELKIGTLPNYFTHALLGDYNYFEDEVVVPELDANGVPLNAASAESRKDPKSKFDPEKMKVDIRKVLDGYSYSMSKRIAYYDVVQYYKSGQFSRDAGQIMLKDSPITAVRVYLNSVIHPEADISDMSKHIRNVTGRLYIAILMGSPTFTLLNPMQRFNLTAFVSKQAGSLVAKSTNLWSGRLKKPNNPLIQSLLDKFQMASAETIMRETEQVLKRLAKNDPNRKLWHRISVWNDEKLATIADHHPGFLAEIGNWNMAFLAGVYQYAMNTPQYQNIIKSNPNQMAAIEKVLQDSNIYDAAFAAGVRTCSKVNPSTNPAYTPSFFKNSTVKIAVMFARFSLNLGQQTIQTITQGKGSRLPVAIENIYSFGDEISRNAGHNLQTANILLKQIKSTDFINTYQAKHGVNLKQAKADIAEMTDMLTSMRDEIYNGISQITPVKRWNQISNMLGFIIANALLSWFVNWLRDKQKELTGIKTNDRSIAASLFLSLMGSFNSFRSMNTVQDMINPIDNYGRFDYVKAVTSLMYVTPGLSFVGGSINNAINWIYGETAVRWAYKRIKDELDY